MEEVLLYRLNMLTNEIKRNSDLIPTLPFINNENKINAEVIYKKLQTLLKRLNDDINNYFKLIINPSADDISKISEIQLEAEQNLAELEVKIKTSTKTLETSTKECISSRLPKLSLLPFDGDILNWCQFWDQFNSNIGSRNIAEVDKLLYLKASVTGDAKKIIDGLETTNKNYQIAVTTLKERYGKISHLIDAHYAALSKVQTSDKATSSCRKTLSDLERHLRVLESLSEDVNHNHLRHLIYGKFPEDLIYELKLKTTSDSIHDIRKNLEMIITAREEACRITGRANDKTVYTAETLLANENKCGHESKSIDYEMGHSKLKKSVNVEHKGRDLSRTRHSENRWKRKRGQLEGSDTKRPRYPCIFCKNNDHFNDRCDKYRTIKERKLQLKNRCYSCLWEGHNINICRKKKRCDHCGKYGDHNKALCPVKFTGKQGTIELN